MESERNPKEEVESERYLKEEMESEDIRKTPLLYTNQNNQTCTTQQRVCDNSMQVSDMRLHVSLVTQDGFLHASIRPNEYCEHVRPQLLKEHNQVLI